MPDRPQWRKRGRCADYGAGLLLGDGESVVERAEQLVVARVGPVVDRFGDEAELEDVGR